MDWVVRHYDPYYRKKWPASKTSPDSARFTLEGLTHDYEVTVERWPSDSGGAEYSVELTARRCTEDVVYGDSQELRALLDAGRRVAGILELLERSLR